MFDKIAISPIEKLKIPGLTSSAPEVSMLREDLLHPHVSGNKWRKLKYNFLEAKKLGYSHVVTFGGAFSNHIAATAACARELGFGSLGIIRGDELHEASNHTLRFSAGQGMKFQFVSRSDYKLKEEQGFLAGRVINPEQYYLLPEGGTNLLAIRGTAEVLGEHSRDFEVICVSAGTGGTAAGIISAALPHQKVLVFSALKGNFLKEEISRLLSMVDCQNENWELISDYHLGGYAKWNHELIDFINGFKLLNGIPLDSVYNGKMVYGLSDLLKKGYFSGKTSILVTHTGGTQSIIGFNEMNGKLIK